MTDQPTMRVTDLVAVAIPVKDQDEALAFYTGLLGCELVSDEVVGPGFRGSRSVLSERRRGSRSSPPKTACHPASTPASA